MQGFITKFAAVYRFICVLILIIMVLIVFINAMMRYMLNSGFIATEEVLLEIPWSLSYKP